MEQNYRQALLEAISQNKVYPLAARRRGLAGTIQVRFVVAADGSIGQIRIERSSGWRVLDRAAVGTLRRLGRFRPIPPQVGRSAWEFLVEIRFALD